MSTGEGRASPADPGWPYSFVAALEPGRTSWTALLDAVRLGPTDDATAVPADQLRAVLDRLIAAGHWRDATRTRWSSPTPATTPPGWRSCWPTSRWS